MSASVKANEFAKTTRPATLRDVARFVRARHESYLYKHGLGPPAADPAMRQYSFTNLKRSLDKGTIALQTIYDQYPAALVGYLTCVSRVINDASLVIIYAPALVPLSSGKLIELMQSRKARGLTVRGNAYLMATHTHAEPFEEFYARRVFPGWWQRRTELVAPHGTLAEYAAWLRQLYGVGPFLAGQVVADLKPRLGWMQRAADRDTWFVMGPGSKRATHILRADASVVLRVMALANDILEYEYEADYRLDAQDAQNVLCEFDKWWRIQNGYGYRRKRNR